MNRRQLMLITGATAAAAGVAHAGVISGSSSSSATQRASYKALLKLGRARSSYKIPKTETKRAKYLAALTAGLSLTPDQQQQADAIFTSALTARTALHAGMKTARQSLRGAVVNG